MNYILFTTTSCPKCPAVKQYIAEKVSFEGQTIDNMNPEFMDLAQKFGVTQAPTFIVLNGEVEIFRGNEVSEIEFFLKNEALAY